MHAVLHAVALFSQANTPVAAPLPAASHRKQYGKMILSGCISAFDPSKDGIPHILQSLIAINQQLVAGVAGK